MAVGVPVISVSEPHPSLSLSLSNKHTHTHTVIIERASAGMSRLATAHPQRCYCALPLTSLIQHFPPRRVDLFSVSCGRLVLFAALTMAASRPHLNSVT